jgi:hypothetical protein
MHTRARWRTLGVTQDLIKFEKFGPPMWLASDTHHYASDAPNRRFRARSLLAAPMKRHEPTTKGV